MGLDSGSPTPVAQLDSVQPEVSNFFPLPLFESKVKQISIPEVDIGVPHIVNVKTYRPVSNLSFLSF